MTIHVIFHQISEKSEKFYMEVISVVDAVKIFKKLRITAQSLFKRKLNTELHIVDSQIDKSSSVDWNNAISICTWKLRYLTADMIAGSLGHELGHVILRAKQIRSPYDNIYGEIFENYCSNYEFMTKKLESAFNGALEQNRSWAVELACDHISSLICSNASFDPLGYALSLYKRADLGVLNLNRATLNHPDGKFRIAAQKAFVKAGMPADSKFWKFCVNPNDWHEISKLAEPLIT